MNGLQDVILNTLEGLLQALQATSGVERPTVVNTSQGIGYDLDLGRYASRSRVTRKSINTGVMTSAAGANGTDLITADLSKYRVVRGFSFFGSVAAGTAGSGGGADLRLFTPDLVGTAVAVASTSIEVDIDANQVYAWIFTMQGDPVIRIPPGSFLNLDWYDATAGHKYVCQVNYDESEDAVIYR